MNHLHGSHDPDAFGQTFETPAPASYKTCRALTCNDPVYALGRCHSHYGRHRYKQRLAAQKQRAKR